MWFRMKGVSWKCLLFQRSGVPSSASVVSKMPGPSYNIIEGGKVVAQFSDKLKSNPSSIPIPSTPPPSYNEVNIQVFYGAVPILSENVDCTNGCRIYANETLNRVSGNDDIMSKSFGPSGAQSICLPDTHPHPQANEIFEAMERGILIKTEDGNVYVTPLCRTMVYCGNSSSDPSMVLERDKSSKVFDYKSSFRPALDHYAFNLGKTPNPYFILSLGQSWGPGRHVTENLVSIVITHSRAKHEIEAIGLTHLLTQDLLINMPNRVDMDTNTKLIIWKQKHF